VTPTTIWIHALGARVGGGVTYLRNVLPQLASLLAERDVRVVLLLPTPVEGLLFPNLCEVRVLPLASRNALTRFLFDQIVLPFWLWREKADALFCSASFAPLFKTTRTIVLLRNAIYFDHNLMRREMLARRCSWRLQSLLIAAGAYTCAAVMYPSQTMRDLVEAAFPALELRGFVNPYGVAEAFADGGKSENSKPQSPTGKRQFLYVMTYTLQKNLHFLLRALIQAKEEALPVQLIVTSQLDDRPPACWKDDWKLIREHKLIESGYLVPVGSQYGADLIKLYQEVDACVFASFCESFGHPLVEALALGKPLVCADWPYARELCGDNALYFHPDKPEELVAIWRTWPTATDRVRPVNHDELLTRFSWREHTRRLLAYLLNVEISAVSNP